MEILGCYQKTFNASDNLDWDLLGKVVEFKIFCSSSFCFSHLRYCEWRNCVNQLATRILGGKLLGGKIVDGKKLSVAAIHLCNYCG